MSPIHSIGWESEKGGEEVALLLLAHSTHTDMNMIQKNKAVDAFDGNNGGGIVQVGNYLMPGGGSTFLLTGHS